ncbi:homoserine kinase [Aerococcus urinaehominis]|uniref:Homoserine kinase n=1 Tax=Aerococcus urinaehominis TaxID=128944 RepID=A0A0X8FMJ4_9LACT|nr:homoserine kinase [Aerococcus urinaehominis]
MSVKIPATSANLGPGFDSIGLAVALYLTIDVIGPSASWRIDHNIADDIPKDENNLVVQTIRRLAPDSQPYHLKMVSDIPSARGLGSSSSAIVAGIELANILANKGWSDQDKVNIANQIEGHPDNIAPCILGGLVVSVALKPDDVLYTKEAFPDVAFVTTIPHYEVKTADARAVLPKHLPFAEAVRTSGIANVLSSKIVEGDVAAVGRLMAYDLFHEPYRQKLVPELTKIRSLLKDQAGAYGTYLSGAGPTIMTLADSRSANDIAKMISQQVADVTVEVLALDQDGSRVLNDSQ